MKKLISLVAVVGIVLWLSPLASADHVYAHVDVRGQVDLGRRLQSRTDTTLDGGTVHQYERLDVEVNFNEVDKNCTGSDCTETTTTTTENFRFTQNGSTYQTSTHYMDGNEQNWINQKVRHTWAEETTCPDGSSRVDELYLGLQETDRNLSGMRLEGTHVIDYIRVSDGQDPNTLADKSNAYACGGGPSVPPGGPGTPVNDGGPKSNSQNLNKKGSF